MKRIDFVMAVVIGICPMAALAENVSKPAPAAPVTISSGDLGSGRISSGDLGSGRKSAPTASPGTGKKPKK